MNAPDTPFPFDAAISAAADRIEPKVIAWRRDFHQNPELGNRELRTAKIVADHLRALGFDHVREKVAHTGVVGVLKGGLPGPAVALRADMDALPVAEVLAGMRERIPGTITFIFQPAEETPPIGEDGGARMMVEQGCLKNPDVGAIFGLHVTSIHTTGMIGYRSGPFMASADDFRVFVRGVQTHAAMPWRGVDPIVVSSQIVLGLQTVVSRRMNITHEPSVVTVGVFQGGNRGNIIPDEVKLEGTIRAFDEGQRDEIHAHVKRISEMIAQAGGATARVHIHRWYDVTVN